MNRKGQALVEFVLILPVFILILLSVVDFGNIIYSKNKLENDTTDIVRMIKNDTSVSNIKEEYKGIEIKLNDYKDKYQKITITKYIDINTPLLDKILGNPCKVKTERVILDE